MKKNRRSGARDRDSTGMRDDFSPLFSLIKYLVLPDRSKSEVCEVDMGASFGEKCFNFYEFL